MGVRYRIGDTTLTYEDGRVDVDGGDPHGFMGAWTTPHYLPNYEVMSDPPVMTTRMPEDQMDFSTVILAHARRLGLKAEETYL